MKYVNTVLKKNCYEELSILFNKTHSPAKEISESYGAFHHILKATSSKGMNMNDFIFIHPGDGSTCRTGGLFTYMSGSQNISIDPDVNEKTMDGWSYTWKPNNFWWYKSKWEDCVPTVKGKIGNKPLGIICVHSHIRTIDILNTYPTWKFCYVNKCCNPKEQLLTTQQIEERDIGVYISGNDNQILSEQNHVIVYVNNKMFKEE